MPDNIRRGRSRGFGNPWTGRMLGWANPRPTNLERLMARALDERGIVYQQFVPIGPYEADFFLPSRGIVIECDGQHWHKGRRDKDERRDKYLRACGLRVFRFTDEMVKSDAAACVSQVLA